MILFTPTHSHTQAHACSDPDPREQAYCLHLEPAPYATRHDEAGASVYVKRPTYKYGPQMIYPLTVQAPGCFYYLLNHKSSQQTKSVFVSYD